MMARPMSGGVAQHRDTPDNTVDTYFDFTEENYKKVEKILGKYPTTFKQAGVIPLLDLAQRQHGGWLPVAAMDKVAKIVGVTPIRVYEVATFYTMFNREKRGKYFIQLCGTTPCMVCGSEDIKNTIMKHLDIEDGGTSKDGMFSLLEVECLGACANAPMIQLNDDYYECLTPDSMIALLEACKAGKPPPMGKWGSLPMNGQVSCEGPKGKTSLQDGPPPPAKMRDDLEKKVDPVSVKQHMHY
jgi:NADH dehydrogenase (ubiquinone) flavoprotein 2